MSKSPVAADATEILTKQTSRTVSETVARLKELLEARGVELFAVIDQRAEARTEPASSSARPRSSSSAAQLRAPP